MQASAFGSQHRDGAVHVIAESDEIVAVCLDGDFDLANAPAVRDEIARALEEGNHLIVDLSEATFIDSTIVHILMQFARAADVRDKAAVLQLGTAANVERMLKIVKIERVLPRAHDREEAVRIIEQQAGSM